LVGIWFPFGFLFLWCIGASSFRQSAQGADPGSGSAQHKGVGRRLDDTLGRSLAKREEMAFQHATAVNGKAAGVSTARPRKAVQRAYAAR